MTLRAFVASTKIGHPSLKRQQQQHIQKVVVSKLAALQSASNKQQQTTHLKTLRLRFFLKKPAHNQPMFNKAVKEVPTVKIAHLPRFQFPSGHREWAIDPPASVCTCHHAPIPRAWISALTFGT
jgi:hypothetical protein